LWGSYLAGVAAGWFDDDYVVPMDGSCAWWVSGKFFGFIWGFCRGEVAFWWTMQIVD
jgi:hypothetical protein